MNFDQQLQNMMNQVDGAHAAVLMGFDGIAVSEVRPQESKLRLQEAIVEYSQLLKEAMKIMQGNDMGGLTEFILSSDRYSLLIRILTPNYFAALFLNADGNVGKGRYVLRTSAPQIQSEL